MNFNSSYIFIRELVVFDRPADVPMQNYCEIDMFLC